MRDRRWPRAVVVKPDSRLTLERKAFVWIVRAVDRDFLENLFYLARGHVSSAHGLAKILRREKLSPGTDQQNNCGRDPGSWKQSIRSVRAQPRLAVIQVVIGVVSSQRRKRDSQAGVVLPWLAPPHFTSRLTSPMMQPRDNKRARLLPSATLDTLDNDLLIRCASYLDADGLAQLGRTSARFGIPQAGQQRSLANEAAHQRFRQSATDEERGCLPKYGDESDIGLYRALELLRQPLRFDELVGNGFGPQENPASVTCTGRGVGRLQCQGM